MNDGLKIKRSIPLSVCKTLAFFLFLIFMISFVLTFVDGLIPFITYDYELLEDGTYAIQSTANGKNVTKIVIPDTHLGKIVSTIKSGAFSGKSQLEEIIIPDSIKTIESSAFYGCQNLVNLDLGSVEKIGDSAFANCNSLKEIVIPNSVKEIGNSAFSDCAKLEKVFFNAIECQDLTASSNLFKGCAETGLRVEIGKDVNRIPAYLLTSTHKDWNRSKETVYRQMYSQYVAAAHSSGFFLGNSNVQVMSFEQWVLSKYSYTAYSSLNVTEIVFAPNSQCKEIGAKAFYKTMIESILIPSSITTIEQQVFGGCKKVSKITFEDTQNWQAIGSEEYNVDFSYENENVDIILDQYDNCTFQKTK